MASATSGRAFRRLLHDSRWNVLVLRSHVMSHGQCEVVRQSRDGVLGNDEETLIQRCTIESAVSAPVHLCRVSLFPSVSLYLSHRICLSVSLSVSVSLCLSHRICLSVSLSVCLTVSLTVSFCICLSLSVFL